MQSDRPLDSTSISAGMQVVDAAGATVGRVKEVLQREFLLDRRMQRDLYVPFDAIATVDGQTVRLDVTADRFGELDWAKPSPLGALDEDPLVAADREVVSRDVLGVGDDIERDTPLDSRPGRSMTAGTDDGALPPPADLLRDEQRRRDLSA